MYFGLSIETSLCSVRFSFLNVLFVSCFYSSINVKADIKSRVAVYPKQLVSLVAIGLRFGELNKNKQNSAQQKTMNWETFQIYLGYFTFALFKSITLKKTKDTKKKKKKKIITDKVGLEKNVFRGNFENLTKKLLVSSDLFLLTSF